MNRVKKSKPVAPGDFNREAYAGLMAVFARWCVEHDLSFAVEVGTYALGRMKGMGAPHLSRGTAEALAAALAGPAPRDRSGHPGNRFPKAPLLVCANFRGLVFTHAEAGQACGKPACYPVSRYVRRGVAIPGTPHVFRFATAEEIAAAGPTRGWPREGCPRTVNTFSPNREESSDGTRLPE